jgi:shikimate dehydrogenase
MRKFGLIGISLNHSWSKEYFHQKFIREGITDCVYEDFQQDDLKNLRELIFRDQELCGLNVTIPFKRAALRYVDLIDPFAEAVQAINCIKIARGGNSINLTGYNTDTIAFRETLKPLLRKEYRKALVLGTGGSSRAVCHALKDLHLGYTLVSRKGKPGVLTYTSISGPVITGHQVIINTTPVGMYPDEGQCLPLPYEALTANHLLYDLIYNPQETIFLKKGREAGTQIKNGLEMLHLQAELSWKIWGF